MTRLTIAALLGLVLAACSGEADFSDAIETGTLDADAYREELLEIDRLVFTATKMDDERREALGARLETLASRVAAEKPEKFMKLESLELRALAKRARRAGSARSMADLENQWMRIRNNLYDDRWWFARSAADLEATATTEAAATQATEGDAAQEITPELPAGEASSAGAVAPYEPLTFPGDAGVPEGRWSVEAVFANGEPRSDPEMSGAAWEFRDGTLSIAGAGPTESFSCEIDGESIRLRKLAAPAITPADGWMLFRRRGDLMHVAFFDNLTGGRPRGFVHEPGGSELLLVVVLRRH